MPASDAGARHQEGEGAMDFGIHFGTRGCLASRDNIIALAQRAEALGYAYLGVADHLVVPVQSDVRYAYTADGIWPGAPTGECFDCIATLAFLAGCTQRLKLLTSVAVVPYRPAVLAAKLFLTADVLSGGRVIAGVGSGWMREEFEALGTPPYAERGAVTDEYLTAWKTLWTEQRPTLHGTHTKFENMMFEPKPTSKPHPPIWVGGESPPALRRVARGREGRARSGVRGCRLPVVSAAERNRADRAGWRAAIVHRLGGGLAGRRGVAGRGRGTARDPVSATSLDRGNLGRDATRQRSGGAELMTQDDDLIGWIARATLAELMAAASARRDATYGRLISYSRKVFIPLTKLCRDVCHYCTFAERPRAGRPAYLSPEDVLTIARAGAAAGCTEALFTLGDKPELRYHAAREALAARGHTTTIEYLREMCSLVLDETGLLPHVNPGVMTHEEIAALRKVSASMGIMLESSSARLCEPGGVHYGSPDKLPEVRLAMMREAGELAVPFT